jgi:hypothetical protein
MWSCYVKEQRLISTKKRSAKKNMETSIITSFSGLKKSICYRRSSSGLWEVMPQETNTHALCAGYNLTLLLILKFYFQRGSLASTYQIDLLAP